MDQGRKARGGVVRGRGGRPATVAWGLLLLSALAVGGGGCGGTAELRPAAGADTVGGGGVALDVVSGVTVTIKAATWPGEPRITRHVTPLEVTVENGSGLPLRIAYENFTLVGPDSRPYRVRPPFQIEGSVERDDTGGGAVAFTPLILHRGFRVAPYVSSVYGDMGVVHSPWYVDPYYQTHFSTFWGQEALPTAEMLERALPEGELEAGGAVDGWLYFDRVDPEARHLVFTARLIDASDRSLLGTITIPFDVVPEKVK